MTYLALALQVLLNVFLFALTVRLIADLARSFARNWRPRGIILVLIEICFTVTDPPLKFVRRFVPNIRLGMISFDLSFAIVWFLVINVARVVSVSLG